jgi:hypothetical protein
MRKTSLIKALCNGLNRVAKTTATKGIYSTELNINFDDLNIDALRALGNYGIIFNDELKTISTDKRDRNFKEFITKETLSYRPLYSERLVDRGRKAGYITSTNDRSLFYSDASRKRAVVLDFTGKVDSNFLTMLQDEEIGHLYVASLFGYFVEMFNEEYKNKTKITFDGLLQEELAKYNELYMANSTMSAFVSDILVRKEDLFNLTEDIDYYYISGKRLVDVQKQLFNIIKELAPSQNANYILKNFEEVTSKEKDYSYLNKKVDGYYQIPIRMNSTYKREDTNLEKAIKGIVGGKIPIEVATKDAFYDLLAKHLKESAKEIKLVFKDDKDLMSNFKRAKTDAKGNYYKIMCSVDIEVKTR